LTKSILAELKLLTTLRNFERDGLKAKSLSYLAVESGVDYCLAWWCLLSLEIQETVTVKRFGVGYAMSIMLTAKGRELAERQPELPLYDESPAI
jgi:hypothetical protein